MQKRSLDSVKIYYPKFSRESLVDYLKCKVVELSKEIDLRCVVLFGSYATGRFTFFSDVDVFVVAAGAKDVVYRLICERLNMGNLELHLYTVNEYERLKENAPSFVKKVMEEGVTIFKAET